MKTSNILVKWWRNDFFIALVLLAAYLLTNSYIYGWDDQHLEIPLLKHLIDPSLYKGDYYVESLARNFSSWLYPILAKFITVKQVEPTYLVLFLVSRYAMFYWVFRLWLLISHSRFAAFSASLMFFLLGRTEEFLYRTFSHQEFSYIFMFAGLYYFYRERYLLAALLLGVGANFHAIYNLFPMLYMMAFLLVAHPKRWSMVFKTGLLFVLASLPFLLWQVPRSLARGGHPPPASEWISLYMLSCPQNFIFGTIPLKEVFSNAHVWWDQFSPYLLLTGLYVFHLVFNPRLRRDGKMHAILVVSWLIMGVAYVFQYVHPSRLVLDLNLTRVEQMVRFFLMGYTTIWAVEQACAARLWLAVTAAILMAAMGTTDLTALLFLAAAAMVFSIDAALHRPTAAWKIAATVLFCMAAAFLASRLGVELKAYAYMPLVWKKFMFAAIGLLPLVLFLLFKPRVLWLRRLLIVVPLAGSFIQFGLYHYHYLQAKHHASGFWQFQRNWKDMQLYVRDHTPKDAMIMTPYNTDLGGFRIFSQRKVLVDYRDCGIIGFDYAAAKEWQQRVKDIEAFKVYTDKPITQAVLTGILKYKVNYIVFMNYYAPKQDNAVLKKMYQDEVFSLFKVQVKVP